MRYGPRNAPVASWRDWTRLALPRRPWDWGSTTVGGFGMLAAVLAVYQVSGVGSPRVRTAVLSAALVQLALVTAALAARVARHPGIDVRTRRAWLLVGVAGVLL